MVSTDEELAKLEVDALPPGTRIWVTHFFSHFGSSDAERDAFQDALREAGFGTPGQFVEIGADEEITGDANWHHWAHTVFEAAAEVLRAADTRAGTLASRYGVRYDGWRVVRRLDMTRAPRVAEADETRRLGVPNDS